MTTVTNNLNFKLSLGMKFLINIILNENTQTFKYLSLEKIN